MFRLLSVFSVLFLLAGPFGLVRADDALTSPPAGSSGVEQGAEVNQGQAEDGQSEEGRDPELEAAEDEELPDDIAAEQEEDEEIASGLEGGPQGSAAEMEIMHGLDSELMEEGVPAESEAGEPAAEDPSSATQAPAPDQDASPSAEPSAPVPN